MFDWKDTSSRSRGEATDSEPCTVTARVGWALVVVTRHIHYPGQWLLVSDDLGMRYMPLKATALEKAKREAEAYVRKRVAVLASAVERSSKEIK